MSLFTLRKYFTGQSGKARKGRNKVGVETGI